MLHLPINDFFKNYQLSKKAFGLFKKQTEMNTNKIPKKILIVDDDKFVCNVYRKNFEKNKIETDFIHSGKDMLNRLQEESYDVILLDILMPEMDGFEALENASKDDLLKDAVVIILSNHADQIAMEKAEQLGCKRFIVKSSLLPEDITKQVLDTYQTES